MILPGVAAMIYASSASQHPIASFTFSPDAPTPQEPILFNASSSYAPNGWIVQYTWDFGDGYVSTVTDPLITHSYPVDGDYTVQLTVTDNNGYTSNAAAVIQVRTVVFFRVAFLGTTIPLANVKVTVYYNNGSAWAIAPASHIGVEIKYDNMTQPNLASNSTEKYRNPGYTASILLDNASNIGFDIHSSSWTVFFKFESGPLVAYWPNDTTRVYTYDGDHGVVETHDYAPSHRAYWDPTASTYVIKAENIPHDGVQADSDDPILLGILFPPPTPTYNLTVTTAPLGITTIPGQGLYTANTNVTLTAPTYVNVSTTTRYRFDYWDVDGVSRGNGVNPITVFMNANHTATAHYVTQYSVTFNQTGLSSDATGTIVTVNGTLKTLTQLPYTLWADNGSSVTYSYTSPVPSSVSGKQFRLNNVTGPTSSIIVSGCVTVTGNYVTQYLVTFAQTGLDSTATGTVVTVNGDAKTYSMLPNSTWFDSGSNITYSYNSPISSSTGGKRFRLNNVTGPSSPITVSGATNVTANYIAQYLVTFNQTGLNSNATSTVVTVNGTAKAYANLPDNEWFDSGSSVSYSYNNVVLSSVIGEQFKLVNVTGSASPITVTGTSTVTGNYKTQYLIKFQQAGVGSDFVGTIVTVDSVSFGYLTLPNSSWWDQGSNHTFAFASPLTVNSTKQYAWNSTSGLSSLQSETLTVTSSGTITGNYIVLSSITFGQTGVGLDFLGTVVIVDGYPYGVSALSVSFNWSIGSMHNFSFQSPLTVGVNAKQYVWTSTSGLSSGQSGSINVTSFGNIIGNYKTQYYLTLATNPPGATSPSGAGWYDSNTYANASTAQFVDIVPGSSRYRFNNWTTSDMSEITNPSTSATTVLMDKNKTVTANYVTQYSITFSQAGVGSDFVGTIVTVDSVSFGYLTLPNSSWWDQGSSHAFTFYSPLVVNVSKQYNWASTSGLTTLQSGTLNVTGSGSVTGNYSTEIKYQVTFSQNGVSSDFAGTVVTIDGTNYTVLGLTVSFWWDSNSVHTFAYQSPLVVSPNVKQYVWTNTTGLSAPQSDSITVTTSGGVTGNYKTQYYLTLATDPSGVNSPSGAGWYDAGTNATVSTDAFVDIVPGSSRYRFNGWNTADMSEISNPLATPTAVFVDKGKTVTASYAVQYNVTFNQSGVGLDFTGPVVVIDGANYTVTTLPASFWWDNNTAHTFAFQSPLVAIPNSKAYGWANTTGLSTSQTGTLTILAPGSVTGNYKTQYYLTATSPYDSPTPASGWFDAGASITASVTSPASGPAGTRYVGTGWSGTGSVPSSGSGTTTTFTMTQASTITWNWKTQYYLTVKTDPSALVTIPGEGWYDASSSVPLNAPPVTGWNFSNWDIDGASQGSANPITANMNAAHMATAHYVQITGQPLTVSINPMAAATTVGNGVPFTSTVSGGTAPYTYQWYLDGNPVSGATSSNWTFVPTTSGVYYVYVVVTDAAHATAQSGTARVEVFPQAPVGGFSISKEKPTPFSLFAAYMGLLALFGTALCLKKRKRK